MKTLILAEKPSVARNIGEAIGKMEKQDGYIENEHYIITWAFGHLLSLFDVKDYDPSKQSWKYEYFPFVPRIFEYKVKPNSKDRTKSDLGAKKQLGIISRLCKRQDVNQIISACDYDREGQIIGDIIFKVIKPSQPVYRLLLNEWTPSAVLNGLNNLKSNTLMVPLRDAGISRQWADWVIGINLTAVTTLKMSQSRQVLNVGRVILPTLKIIYDRDEKIKDFEKEKYYKLNALFLKDAQAFEATYYNDKDKFKDHELLEHILEELDYPNTALKGIVSERQFKRKKEYPPLLFNLSNLQGYITSKHRGWTSSKVLNVAQKLYEKKFITYPRTSSLALEESLIEKTKKVLERHSADLPYKDDIEFKVTKRIFDNKKVESHSAIIPTYLLPKGLSNDELTVYYAIKNRFIKQFMPLAEVDETKLKINIKEHEFRCSGRIVVKPGWHLVEKPKTKDHVLPIVEEGDELDVRALNISTHETKPPNKHTEKTLLKVMETCGKSYKEDSEEMIQSVLSGFSIGTAATRADVISKLKRIGYIEQQQKSLTCTLLGKSMVEQFPIKSLFDLEYTGRLEKQLSDIAKGELSKNTFLHDMFRFTADSVETIKNMTQGPLTTKPQVETLGKCPSCGGNIIETKKSFGCDRWKQGCKYVIWKNDKFFASMKKKPTKTLVKNLLKKDRVKVKGFVGKSGQKFDAFVKYEKQGDGPYYQWKIEFK